MKLTPVCIVIVVLIAAASVCSATDENDSTDQKPVISASACVFEGGKGMKIFSDGRVTGYSTHYVPSHKDVTIKEGYISREEVDALLELFSKKENIKVLTCIHRRH